MKKQILVCIHGGESWDSENSYIAFLKNEFTIARYSPKPNGWKTSLRDTAYSLGWDVYMPEFPSKIHAKYTEWKIVFEKILDTIQSSNISTQETKLIFVGHSLGGCFLFSYLSSEAGACKFQGFTEALGNPNIQLHSVAGCISIGDFLGPNTEGDWGRLTEVAKKYPFHIWHSRDDTIVPFSDARILTEKIEDCKLHSFTDRFHFVGSDFFELTREIFDQR